MGYHFTAKPTERIEGDVVVDGVLIPFANLQVWSDELLAHYGIVRYADIFPVDTVPASVTRRQFMLALHRTGLLEQAEELVANHPYAPVRIEWANTSTFDRNNPALLAMAMEMDKTDEEIDALFTLAATYL